MPERNLDERRLRKYLLHEETFLHILNFKITIEAAVERGEHIWYAVIPKLKSLPNNTIFKNIHYDFMYQKWTLICWSMEFDIVPEGEQIPAYNDLIQNQESIKIKKDDKFNWREHSLL